jgi:cation:H+ antiporter
MPEQILGTRIPKAPVFFELSVLLAGIGILAYCSERGVNHAVRLAGAFGVPTIVVGVLVVSIGTDLPEIANSIMSSVMGHGDLNVGDSLGSCLTQITLVLGLVGIVSGGFRVDREEILELGRSTLMGLLLAILLVRTNYVSRLDAAILLVGYVLLVIAVRRHLSKNYQGEVAEASGRTHFHLFMLLVYMSGIALGAYMLVTSAVSLSRALSIPEYVISFFVLAVGTSLPELVVDLAAARKGEFGLAMGDVIGSCIVDSTLSIGIGPLISPIELGGGLAFTSGIWTFVVSAIVFVVLGLRGRMDRKIGAFFVLLYLLSYLIVFV